MRRLIAPALLVLALAASACDLPSDAAPEPDDGTMTGSLNGQPWRGDAATGTRGDTVWIFSSSYVSGERHLAVATVPLPTGEYALVPAASRYAETVGRDVLTYSAAITGGTVSLVNTRTSARGSMQLSISGTRGDWQFTGEFELPR